MPTTKEMIAIMQAYEAGEEIEYYSASLYTWTLLREPSWAWDTMNYRVKPTAWYRDIPEGGVLCRVWDGDFTHSNVALVAVYLEGFAYLYCTDSGAAYEHAEPLQPSEVRALLKTAKTLNNTQTKDGE